MLKNSYHLAWFSNLKSQKYKPQRLKVLSLKKIYFSLKLKVKNRGPSIYDVGYFSQFLTHTPLLATICIPAKCFPSQVKKKYIFENCHDTVGECWMHDFKVRKTIKRKKGTVKKIWKKIFSKKELLLPKNQIFLEPLPPRVGKRQT